MLIVGEAGTGKSLVANSIFSNSNRTNRRFSSVPCSNIHPYYEAIKQNLPRLKGGFIFFDGLEAIDTTGINIFQELLPLIHQEEITLLSSYTLDHSEEKLILKDKIDPNLLSVFERIIEVPPLRNRKQDIPALVGFFINQTSQELMLDNEINVSEQAMQILTDYDYYYDNVRELKSIIREAVLLVGGAEKIETNHLRIFTEELNSTYHAESQRKKKFQIFISYSHEDEYYARRLRKHFSALIRKGVIETWYDREIIPGQLWEEVIEEKLSRADLILLLISADFIHSDYCYEREMDFAVARHLAGLAKIVPIIVKPSDWKETPIAKFQALPKDGKPISSWEDQDEALLDVIYGIKSLLNE